MKNWSNWVYWSLGLLFFQSFVLSQIQVYGYLNPYVYLLVILLVPASASRISLLVIGALVGGFMDFQMLSGGMHLMASTLLAYLRPFLLDFIVPRASEENLGFTRQEVGWQKWVIYTLLGTFIHHFYLFAVDAHGLYNPLGFLWRSFLSAMATVVLMLIMGILMKPSAP